MKATAALCTVAAYLALTGCTSTIESRENMLVAAGFRIRPADTPGMRASIEALPPNRFVRRIINGNVVYLYADPTVCRCVFYGDQTAYGTYQRMVFEQNLADQQQMTAMMNRQAAWGRYWGRPGPFWY